MASSIARLRSSSFSSQSQFNGDDDQIHLLVNFYVSDAKVSDICLDDEELW